MKMTKTFSFSIENIEWLKENTTNMSEFLDQLITDVREQRVIKPLSEWDQTFVDNKDKSAAAYQEWLTKRQTAHKSEIAPALIELIKRKHAAKTEAEADMIQEEIDNLKGDACA